MYPLAASFSSLKCKESRQQTGRQVTPLNLHGLRMNVSKQTTFPALEKHIREGWLKGSMQAWQVVSCSSQDPAFPASNILISDMNSHWQTASASSVPVEIVLGTSSPLWISQLTIVNFGSVLVELWGKNDDKDPWHIVLPSSAFRSVIEVQKGSALQRSRKFARENLRNVRLPVRYVLLRVSNPWGVFLCGLTSIAILTASQAGQSTSAPLRRIGIHYKKVAEAEAEKDSSSSSRNHDIPAKPAVDVRPSPTPVIPKEMPNDKKRKVEESVALPKASLPAKKPSIAIKEVETKQEHASSSTAIAAVRPPALPAVAQPLPSVPLNQLLAGVCFAISGIENPERNNVRSIGTSMGATYHPDWKKGRTTHLIGHFNKAPKVLTAEADGGIVVVKEWLYECQKRKMKVPVRKWLLNPSEDQMDSSDSEHDLSNHVGTDSGADREEIGMLEAGSCCYVDESLAPSVRQACQRMVLGLGGALHATLRADTQYHVLEDGKNLARSTHLPHSHLSTTSTARIVSPAWLSRIAAQQGVN